MSLITNSAVLVFLVCAVTCQDERNIYFKAPPVWPATYSVNGTLRLPYAEINEPFTAYYDGKNKRSRVNYYENVVTIQLAAQGKSYGMNYKVVPAFLGGKQTTSCFLVNGTKESPSTVQTVLPDTSGFKPGGEGKINGQDCNIWQKIVMVGVKKNTYTLWTNKKGGFPVRYEMMGYDSLLGSHYDKYYIDYNPYSTKNISGDVFKPKKGMKCGKFPGPGAEGRISMNPMHEYIHNDDQHTTEMFDHFKKNYNKQYMDKTEHSKRIHTFRQNVRFISSKNRAGLTYSLKVNHMTDLFDSELRRMNGRIHSKAVYNGGLPFDASLYNVKSLPEQIDWRLYGAVTPVKDQAVCGSCWSFGSTGTLEGAYFMKTGRLVRLSQQELMDCSWDQGNNACDGGEDFRAYDFIKKFGLASEDSYGPYKAQDGVCNMKSAAKVLTSLKSFVNVTSGDLQALKMALAKHGPISVSIDASHKTLSYYANGVYFEPECGNKPDSLDHSVLAVGYGVLNGQPYWLIKNSWSTYWGNDGYVLMSMKDNNCGVATAATFVNL